MVHSPMRALKMYLFECCSECTLGAKQISTSAHSSECNHQNQVRILIRILAKRLNRLARTAAAAAAREKGQSMATIIQKASDEFILVHK